MQLTAGEIYHVYNRGNNRQPIFIRPWNYPYFIKGMERYLVPYCDLLAWCLMPNHFHFLVHANENSTPIIKDGSFERQRFSQAIKQLLSSYTKAVNKQENRTGSLFQQKTKAICVTANPGHDTTAFHYIHQNPVKAGLAKGLEDWEFSSYTEYFGNSKYQLCNLKLAHERLAINYNRFAEESNAQVSYISEM